MSTIKSDRSDEIPAWDLVCYACKTKARRPVINVHSRFDALPIFMFQVCDDCALELAEALIKQVKAGEGGGGT